MQPECSNYENGGRSCVAALFMWNPVQSLAVLIPELYGRLSTTSFLAKSHRDFYRDLLLVTPNSEDNPYTSPETASKVRRPPVEHVSPWKSALAGATWSVISTFPIAAVTALLYRFPVPFVGYLSGIKAVVPALFAVLFYGVPLGGLVLLGVLGALGGFISAMTFRADRRRCQFVTRAWALIVSAMGILTLAVLDKIIGPW